MTEEYAEEVQAFYDDLAASYHEIYEDWGRAVMRQGEILDALIRARLGENPKRILDCTAGIGTQALGLSERGHDVVGTDLSEGAVARASAEARRRGLSARFERWDIRRIRGFKPRGFDVVLSADNSLPHLVDLEDLERALEGMWAQLRRGGLLIVTLRDYDRVLENRPTIERPRVLGQSGNRRVVLQLWDWRGEEPTYDLTHLLLRERDGEWEIASRCCTYRAVSRSELESRVMSLGPAEVEWVEPEVSGFFQPILCARASD